MNQPKKTNGKPIQPTTNKGAGAGKKRPSVAPYFATGADTYALVAAGLRIGMARTLGDITGNQGKGGGAAKLRKARAVGVGRDAETVAADEFEAWVATSAGRAMIGGAVQSERDGWSLLQRLARRAAGKAARRVEELRGVKPSETSRDDAAADAAAAVAYRFPVGCLRPVNFTGARVRILARYAGRAAFRSLASWAACGMTGDNTSRRLNVDELTARLADTIAQASSPDYEFSAQRAARRAAVRWVYSVGLRQFATDLVTVQPGGRAKSLASARARCRVVASVILGTDLAGAVAGASGGGSHSVRWLTLDGGQWIEHVEPLGSLPSVAGFSSVAAFKNSCQSAGLWQALSAARARVAWDGSQVEQARVAMREHALRAADCIRALRASSSLYPESVASPVRVVGGLPNGGAWAVVRRAVAPYSPAVARLWDERASHVERAIHWRNVATRAAAADLASFNRVLDCLHDEDSDLSNLRRTFGITDKRGRVRNGSKIDGAVRRAGNGKVQRTATAVATVAIEFPRGGARPCALAAPESVPAWAGLPAYLPA